MFDKLKSMVWQENDGAKPQAPPATRSHQPVTQPVTQQVAQQEGSVLDLGILTETLDAAVNGSSGFADYIAFQLKADALASVISDEPTRFKAAGATSGISKDVLIASVNSSVAILSAEAENFETAYVGQAATAIQAETDNISNLEILITAKAEELASLQAQKAASQQNLLTATADLAKAKIDFGSVYQALTNKYATIAGKIQQYL